MTYKVEDIIQENLRRLEVIHTPYDPQVGTEYSDIIKRSKIEIPDAPLPVQYIPVEMESEWVVQLIRQEGSLKKAAKAAFGKDSQRAILRMYRYFIKTRCRYDFEYWGCTQIKIKLKGKPKRDYLVLNRAQRYFLTKLEELRKAGQPIFIILLKARQWGGSTLTQMYMFWIQKMHKKHWNSVIVGDVEKQSKVVLSMYEKACEDYDPFIDEGVPTVLKPFGRTHDIRELEGRGCTISVGSMVKPDKIRSEDISMAHFTEFGIWRATDNKSPDDVKQSIDGTILDDEYSMWVIESTAKGVGNAFHNMYMDAKKGTSKFTPVFVPWFMIDIYSRAITGDPTKRAAKSNPLAYAGFINRMTDYDWQLWNLGATLEAINWYHIKSRGVDEWRMKSEYPSTDIEAFQSTGRAIFKEKYLDDLAKSCCPPTMIGDIVSSYHGPDNKRLLENLRFEQNERGHLKIWKDVDTSVKMRSRYVVIVDLGKGSSNGADPTIATVFDRYWQQEEEDGYPEVAAELCIRESETDLLAWKLAQIAAYYDNALLVIESNTIDSSKEERFRAILEHIAPYYENLYKRPIRNKNDIASTGGFRYGWNTNHRSKEKIISYLDWAAREGMYVEREIEAVNEMRIFERHEDGSLGNVVGKNNHDDRVVTRGIGMVFCYEKMETPRVVSPSSNKPAPKRKFANEYTMT